MSLLDEDGADRMPEHVIFTNIRREDRQRIGCGLNPNWRHSTGAGYNCSNGSWQVQLLHAQNTPNELEQL